ncbi:MAG: hypothetical protein JXB24_03385 [Bacteroidales bacterium]|nr:hypothetical protein [Bacteroidales bacterium]
MKGINKSRRISKKSSSVFQPDLKVVVSQTSDDMVYAMDQMVAFDSPDKFLLFDIQWKYPDYSFSFNLKTDCL